MYHLLEFGISVFLQWWYGNWIFSTEHLTLQNGFLDWNTIISVVFVVPFQEEVVFHGFIFYIFCYRYLENLFIMVLNG